MPFTVMYGMRTEHFAFPVTTSTPDVKEAVAAVFGVAVGSFAIRKIDTSVVSVLHDALEGDFELIVNASHRDTIRDAKCSAESVSAYRSDIVGSSTGGAASSSVGGMLSKDAPYL